MTFVSRIVFLLLFLFLISTSQSPQKMIVKIDEVREMTGQLMIYIYNTEDDFPTKRDRAFASKKIPVSSASMTVDFDGIPSGTYGIAVYHDENMNDKMDRSWYGMPNEGYGASNDARGTFGPPKFADAKYEFKSMQDTVKIVIHY
ncbi:MAG: DUF2141 domain-containing protein [Bacteroidota bacterium]